MINFTQALALSTKAPWIYGIHVSEAVELVIVLTLFIGVLITVYFIQIWIGDY